MDPSADMTSESQEAAATLFALLYRPGPSWIEGKPITGQPLGPHRAYIEQLFAAGRVVLAGPFLDGPGGGFAVVRAADEARARALLADDPAISGGVFVGEVRHWFPMFDSARELRAGYEARREAACNVAVMRGVFAAVEAAVEGRGTTDFASAWDAYQRAYDPDVAIHEAPSLPYGGDYTGANAVSLHAQGFINAWQGLRTDDERALEPRFLAEGDCVAVLWRQRGHNPSTGERFDMPAMSLYAMREGRIIDSRMFHFDAGAVREFLERAGRGARK
jgi:uncharacterized protein YciI